MNDPSRGMQCSGIRRSFRGGEGIRAHIQAAGKPTLAMAGSGSSFLGL